MVLAISRLSLAAVPGFDRGCAARSGAETGFPPSTSLCSCQRHFVSAVYLPVFQNKVMYFSAGYSCFSLFNNARRRVQLVGPLAFTLLSRVFLRESMKLSPWQANQKSIFSLISQNSGLRRRVHDIPSLFTSFHSAIVQQFNVVLPSTRTLHVPGRPRQGSKPKFCTHLWLVPRSATRQSYHVRWRPLNAPLPSRPSFSCLLSLPVPKVQIILSVASPQPSSLLFAADRLPHLTETRIRLHCCVF